MILAVPLLVVVKSVLASIEETRWLALLMSKNNE
jgi:predicted PurR-regulated permease PerM